MVTKGFIHNCCYDKLILLAFSIAICVAGSLLPCFAGTSSRTVPIVSDKTLMQALYPPDCERDDCARNVEHVLEVYNEWLHVRVVSDEHNFWKEPVDLFPRIFTISAYRAPFLLYFSVHGIRSITARIMKPPQRSGFRMLSTIRLEKTSITTNTSVVPIATSASCHQRSRPSAGSRKIG